MKASAAVDRTGIFSAVAVLWMLIAGGASALLFLVLTAYAPDLRQTSDGGTHALSKSAVGFAGLTQLLRDEGVPVLFSRSSTPPGKAARACWF